MPTNRQRRRRERIEEVSKDTLSRLSDGLFPMPENPNVMERFLTNDVEVWPLVRDEIIDAWAVARPGRRPQAWWCFSAPRCSDEFLRSLGIGPDDFLWRPENRPSEPRRRISGVGTPKHEILAHVPSFHCGIPESWVSPWEVLYYSGKATNIHGNPIGTEFAGKRFKGEAVDPLSPPKFESQASYLLRHNLFLPGERRKLQAADFEAEVLPLEYWSEEVEEEVAAG